MYEALLFFERLQEVPIEKYEFANGAPAVGATLDLSHAAAVFKAGYRGKSSRKSLYSYFFNTTISNIKFPKRRYNITNDPVMTPKILDHFFNQRSQLFSDLDDRRKSLLWSVYNIADFRSVLPMMQNAAVEIHPLRRHQRYSIRCPAAIIFQMPEGEVEFSLNIIEVSLAGFQAETKVELPIGCQGVATVELGKNERSHVTAVAVRYRNSGASGFVGFKLEEIDGCWRDCVAALDVGMTSSDLLQ